MKSQESFINPQDRFAEQVRLAAAGLKINAVDYELIRSGTNDVFADGEAGVVARVASDYISQPEIESQISNCRQLVEAGAPIVPPLVDEVVVLESGRCVSFWPLGEIGPPPDGHEMAEVLAACHRLDAPPGLSDWHPDLFVDRRWATLRLGVEAGLPAEVADSLTGLFSDALDRLKQVCAQCYDPKTGSFIHGDTHHSNFIRYQGRLVLCDPDNICRGPREKDLANIWESCRRQYVDPQYWEQLKADYPLEYDQDLLDILTRVQEIGGCLWMTQFWGSRPESRPAITHSIETIDQPNARWLDF